MIIVYHNNNKVISVFDHQHQEIIPVKEGHIMKTLMHLASIYNSKILVWCRLDCKALLNFEAVNDALKIKNAMVSFGHGVYMPNEIGYVERTPFININTKVKYPTWIMHATVGAIYSSTLLKFKDFNFSKDFDYDLNSIAKLGMPRGLFCYSEPKLLIKPITSLGKSAEVSTLFKFVKQHYRTRWVFLLAFNFLWHERKLPFLSLLKCLFFKKREFKDFIPLEAVKSQSVSKLPSIDVIIPTIGRAKYLYDVLKDLAKQTHLPNQVIIVEQNPDMESSSELNFMTTETWPFKIDHHFIHQTGVCNARNIALKKVISEYVYLADDDNKFDNDLIEKVLYEMLKFNLDVVCMSYLQRDEVEQIKQPMQWPTFGAGCSVMKSSYLNTVAFNRDFEFGYGEDADFGMQLRNMGADIIYLPHINILHLKAPIGGFRSTFKQPWLEDKLQPKPSPTVMLYNLKHNLPQQLKGYKTLLFFKFYKKQAIKNPISYFKHMNARWEKSLYWADQLMKNPK